MKNNIIYFFSVLIIEIGLLLQWFTLRRITMIILYYLIITPINFYLYKELSMVIYFIVLFINCCFLISFIKWNFKKKDNGY